MQTCTTANFAQAKIIGTWNCRPSSHLLIHDSAKGVGFQYLESHFYWLFFGKIQCTQHACDTTLGHDILNTVIILSQFWRDKVYNVSRCPNQDGLIFTQNLADVLHVQNLLLKCPNLAPWDSQWFSCPQPLSCQNTNKNKSQEHNRVKVREHVS